jgi:hypothetical protein
MTLILFTTLSKSGIILALSLSDTLHKIILSVTYLVIPSVTFFIVVLGVVLPNVVTPSVGAPNQLHLSEREENRKSQCDDEASSVSSKC